MIASRGSMSRALAALVMAGALFGTAGCGTSVSAPKGGGSQGPTSAPTESGPTDDTITTGDPQPSDSPSETSSESPLFPTESPSSSESPSSESSSESSSSSSELEAKLVKTTDPFGSSSDVFKPPSGSHWVMVEVTIKNTSSKSFTISGLLDVDAITSTGEKAQYDIMGNSGDGTKEWPTTGIEPGQSATGTFVYTVKDGQKLKELKILPFASVLDGKQPVVVKVS